jgi:putative transposase
MEQKRDLVRIYNSLGLKLDQALEVVGMAKSTYYFKRKHTRSGRRKTTQTLFKGFMVDDSFVVACIKEIISKDYIDYGYQKCTVNLCRLGFEIGDKKVYRLMDESNLLNPPKKI